MLKVALTGNIGSGKSTVAKVFEILGVPVFNADNEARKLYSRQDVIDKLTKIFTDKILNNTGEVDTKVLASIIFSNEGSLKTVNGIIHPMVLQEFNNWLDKHKDAPYVIHEAAVIFENNLQDNFDRIIVVSADEELRIDRVINRDGSTREKVVERVNNQLSDQYKCKHSDYVIYNNESDFLIPQVLKIHKEII